MCACRDVRNAALGVLIGQLHVALFWDCTQPWRVPCFVCGAAYALWVQKSGKTLLTCCFYYSNIITISNNNISEYFLNFLNMNTRGHFQICLLLRSQYRHLVFCQAISTDNSFLRKKHLLRSVWFSDAGAFRYERNFGRGWMTESSYRVIHNPIGESWVRAPCHLHRMMLSFSNSVACYRTVCGVNLLEDKCLAAVTDCRL